MPSDPSGPDLGRRLPWVALGLFVVAASAFRVRSTDVFWHLVSGRWIVEHREIPKIDPFRFTSEGLPWVDHEWLFQVLLFSTEALGGLPALVALRIFWVALLALVLAVAVRRTGLGGEAAALLVFLGLLGARPRFLLRPELLTFLCLGVLFLLLRRFAVGGPAKGPVAALGGLTVLWVNLHGMAVLAPAITGLYLFGARLENALATRRGRGAESPGGAEGERADGAESALPFPGVDSWSRVFGLPVLPLLCLLVNPYGWHVFGVAGGITGAMRGLEAYNPEWVPLWTSPQPFLLIGAAALLGLVLYARRRGVAPHLPTLLPVLFLLAVAVTAVRHQALFSVAAVLLAAETLAALARCAGVPELRRSVVATASAGAILAGAFWCVAPPSSGPLQPRQGRFQLGIGIERGKFPEKAADFLERHPEVGPLFNSFAHGGYLLWRLYPPRRVFHEGRMELQPGLLREIGEARKGNREWDDLLSRYGATGALVAIDPRRRPSLVWNEQTQKAELEGYFTANTLLFPQRRYALVYWDDLTLLFLDRTQPQPAELMAQEYKLIQPEDPQRTLERVARDPNLRQAALLELERKLRQDPESQLALDLRAALRGN